MSAAAGIPGDGGGYVDLSTITGLLLGSVCVALALVLGESFAAFLDPAALLIVLGGAGAAILVSTPIQRLFQVHRVILKTIRHRSLDPRDQIERLVSFSGRARREGILALEGMLDDVDDPILVRGLQLAIDGAEPEEIRAVLKTELEAVSERHAAGRSLFERLGKYAIAFGMIGTIIGFITVLANMQEPAAIASGLATALLPVLYGVILANLVFRPLADKLAARSSEELLVRSMAIQGVLAIQAGENPRNVDSKLRIFLPPRSRTITSRAA